MVSDPRAKIHNIVSGSTVDNLVQAHSIEGGVHFHQPGPWRPVEGAEYVRQVRKLAPEVLQGREEELAALAKFATEPELPGWYQWWKAPAWAGKSALLASFVVNPPEGVRIVSFFVNARQRGEDDRGGYVAAVLEQLAEIVDDRPPPQGGSALERHLQGMLHAAAKRCVDDGMRLILVVDGLDEDRGADDYSIAGLLPDEQVAGIRVVVSGRPNRPIPSDVPSRHPLHDTKIVRMLTPSPVAKVVRDDMQRELRKLLRGGPLEKDILGFTTAARGGLNARDLAELTNTDLSDVESCLDTVIGRTFSARSAHWRDSEVLVLAHKELLAAATEAFKPPELAHYRERLHEWADRYRNGGWPEDTPEYVLRGYFRMLNDNHDLERMINHATDLRRQNLLRDPVPR
jgi:hypothetical protein